MPTVYDNWERLVTATLLRETLLASWRMGSLSGISNFDSDSDSNFESAIESEYKNPVDFIFGNFNKGLQKDFKTTSVPPQKYIEKFPDARELIEGLFKQLSALLFYGDKEINKLLLRGRYLTRKLNQWVTEARMLKCEVSDLLQESKNRQGQWHGHKVMDLGIKIINQLKQCPFMEEQYDNQFKLMVLTHKSGLDLPSAGYEKKSTHTSIENTKIKQKLLHQVAEMKLMKLTSVEKSVPASISKPQGELRPTAEITKADVARNDEETMISSSSIRQRQNEKAKLLSTDFCLQPAAETVEADVEPNKMTLPTSAEILPVEQMEGGFSSSHAEESKHHGKSIPRPPRTSNLHFLQNTVIVTLSITGEMSKFVDLKLEILHASSSQEMQHLKNDFSYMDLVPKREHYSFLVKKKLAELDFDEPSMGEHSLSGQLESSKLIDTLLPKHVFLNNAGGGSVEFSDGEWHQACVVDISSQDVSLLPEKPNCPDLVLLFLQRNNCLIEIPSTFFCSMPALRFLDLSLTRIKILPNSLFLLTELQVLMLRNCVCLDKIPSEIGNLHHMEVLDLWGTELINFPVEIGQLTSLKHLQVSFYGPDEEIEYIHLPPELISLGIISRLQGLQELTIVVHPEDHRWTKNARDMVQDVGSLKMLTFLQFYFPEVKTFKDFIEISPSWNKQKLRRFKFVIGHNVKRIISRVPDEVESEYNRQGKCLRYVNGDEVPEAIKMVLMHATAFYLDHHVKVQKVTEFGISNLKELKFLVVRECPEVQIIGEDMSESVFPSLEHFGVHYLWKLEQIWKAPLPLGSFHALKYLMVSTCPKLEFILTKSMLQCLNNMVEFVVEDCEFVRAIIEQGNETVTFGGAMLPLLEKLVLRWLPELVSLGIDLPEEKILTYGCPKLMLNSESKEQIKVKQRKLLGSLFCCSTYTRDSID